MDDGKSTTSNNSNVLSTRGRQFMKTRFKKNKDGTGTKEETKSIISDSRTIFKNQRKMNRPHFLSNIKLKIKRKESGSSRKSIDKYRKFSKTNNLVNNFKSMLMSKKDLRKMTDDNGNGKLGKEFDSAKHISVYEKKYSTQHTTNLLKKKHRKTQSINSATAIFTGSGKIYSKPTHIK